MSFTKKGFASEGTVVFAVLCGTLMPGSIKAAVERQLLPVVPWSGMAHFGLFALLTWVVCQRGAMRVMGPALLLAAVLGAGTEWLQHWVPGRHPRLIDVAIDMSGALFGCAVAVAMQLRSQRKKRPTAIAVDRF